MSFITTRLKSLYNDKTQQVVLFSSTAIALYGYDQGMMSLINTNHNYLHTMGIAAESPIVGIIVSVYYLGCAVGAVFFSWWADKFGRKKAIFFCLATASLGNLIMFIAGLGYSPGARSVMLLGRVVMGLGVGGVDSVIPIYSSELTETEARGKALAQEFQSNIFGLLMAFGINIGVTRGLGKGNQWAWRLPIIIMQVYPIILLSFVHRLPESARWFVRKNRKEDAKKALQDVFGEEGQNRYDELIGISEDEEGHHVSYLEMMTPGQPQFHPTMVTIMGQINQALTGYGAVSVYGPQIFELLSFSPILAEYLTLGNYTSYFFLMSLAWLLIDALGRRRLLVESSGILTTCFLLLTLFAALTSHSDQLHILVLGPAIAGTLSLFVATGAFGIGWLTTVWLIPTEIYPTYARARGTAISVIVWGIANFGITLLTPIMFNNLKYYIFLVFAATNAIAGTWTYFYLPETGGRSFEENQEFFVDAKEVGSWQVRKVKGGAYKRMPYKDEADAERVPLLHRIEDQLP
ncbi:general substrate transporter [Mytilinidion resinicola]|uniref:General substrate transporter n=1 Tax=Mytilinidion resinicola TaxID=574789 RepID=A0A6A6YQV3_9PEZI|nr:general substrate transporter [Mytilinidion resinicola]KAF2810365.1 general substrate transporter [Mytilinidion resinicola]